MIPPQAWKNQVHTQRLNNLELSGPFKVVVYDWSREYHCHAVCMYGVLITGQGKGSNWDLFSNQYLFQKSLLSLTLENHKHPIDSH